MPHNNSNYEALKPKMNLIKGENKIKIKKIMNLKVLEECFLTAII